MKKAKITVNPGSPGRVLPLFLDSETAYCWLTEPMSLDDIDGVTKLTLLPGEFIEVEWLGCEFAYNNETKQHSRFDAVRLAKGELTGSAGGVLATIYSGWTHESIITFKDYADEFITIKPLIETDSMFHLPTLFQDVVEEPEKK